MIVSLDSSDASPHWPLPVQLCERAIVGYSVDDAIKQLRQLQNDRRWVGFLSYDLGRGFESLPASARDDLHLPACAFVEVGAGSAPRTATLAGPQRGPSVNSNGRVAQSTFSRADYLQAVQRVIDYISAGDVFQINLSQRFSVPIFEPARAIYDRLQSQSPAKHGAYLDFGDFQILSNSPELFLRIEPLPDGRRKITTRPIKGTRPNLPGKDIELLDSKKDQAELNMIVDLERNDLGRICEIGSVRVTEPRAIEKHPTVIHGVATIEGILRKDVSFVDILRATFPGGSITGAPKIRAMEIIEELEPVRRGPYCGSIVHIHPSGVIEMSIAIRTMIIKEGVAYFSVGGGIVADSVPEKEYEETIVKAQALCRALGVVI